MGVDFVALSFVRCADDVIQLRERMGAQRVPIIAKIEKPEALTDIDAILEAGGRHHGGARGSGRGDVAGEGAADSEAADPARAADEPVRDYGDADAGIDDRESPNPTRAEVSDVANAIYDGSDAVMLSAETAVGKYPLAAVEYMGRIAREVERGLRRRGFADVPSSGATTDSDVMADAVYHAARAADVQAIVVFTETGYSARLISRYRPPVKILAMTASRHVARRLTVNFGVVPVLAPEVGSTDDMLAQIDTLLVRRKLLKAGDKVVFAAGQPVGRAGSMNLMKLHRVKV